MRLTVSRLAQPPKWMIAVNKERPCDFYPKRSVIDMKVRSIQLRFCCKLTLIAFFLAVPTIRAQSSAVHTEAAPAEQHLRSRLFTYDLRDGTSRLVYTADTIW